MSLRQKGLHSTSAHSSGKRHRQTVSLKNQPHRTRNKHQKHFSSTATVNKTLKPRFEQTFLQYEPKIIRRLNNTNKTVRTRSRTASPSSSSSSSAAARAHFVRVKKNSLNRNFYNTIGVRNNCTHQVCFPPIGNLLIGRRNFLFASSTCGIENAERFCILG